MPFLTQTKTNWKFLLIVIVLAVIVGGGILFWQYFEPHSDFYLIIIGTGFLIGFLIWWYIVLSPEERKRKRAAQKESVERRAFYRVNIWILALIVFFAIGLLAWIVISSYLSAKERMQATEKSSIIEMTDIFDFALPVSVVEIYPSGEHDIERGWYDFSAGGLLKDADGKEFKFSLDKRPSVEREEKEYDKHYFYIGADHPDKETAQKISYGSEEEKQLLKILESWDHSGWQPKHQFDNTKTYVLMFIRELNNELFSYRNWRDTFYSYMTQYKQVGEMNRLYQNKELGFEFKFPENWFIEKCYIGHKEVVECININDPIGTIGAGMELAGASFHANINIAVEDPANYGVSNIEEFIELLTSDDTHGNIYSGVKEGEIDISGENAYIMNISVYGHEFLIVLEKDNYLYLINFTREKGANEVKFEESERIEIERQILSTFRFLE